MAATANAQSDWPDADSIIGVSLVVFEHENAPMTKWAQEGLTSFPAAVQLPKTSELLSAHWLQSRLDDHVKSRQADSAKTPTRAWSMENWLDFLHAGVLSELDQPITGPPLPPTPTAPLLNSPLLMRESFELPDNLRRAIGRLDASDAHKLLRTMHWYQVLDRRGTGARIYVTDKPTERTTPWRAAIEWIQHGRSRPVYVNQLAGYIQLTQDQFTRADLNLCLHETQRERSGPYRRSNLAPTGYQVTCLAVNRAIEPNQWNYFDSETLGVLLRVSTP